MVYLLFAHHHHQVIYQADHPNDNKQKSLHFTSITMPGNIIHSVATFLSAVVAVLLTGAITDGRSVIKVSKGGLYGIGVYQDTNGRTWHDKAHGAYGCDELKKMGQAILAFALLSLVLEGLCVLVHALGASTGKKVLALAGIGMHAFATVCLIITWSLAAALYSKEFCNSKLKDNFDLTYGLPFLVVGSVVTCALTILSVVAMRTSEPAADKAAAEGDEVAAEVKETAPDATAA